MQKLYGFRFCHPTFVSASRHAHRDLLHTGNPRAENDEYLMSLGIANSLPEALQSATSELANWLQRDYKLEPNEAAVVLGTAIQYNIAEVVDPLVHVVAKIRKDTLAKLK